jgi:hypothetical protein
LGMNFEQFIAPLLYTNIYDHRKIPFFTFNRQ